MKTVVRYLVALTALWSSAITADLEPFRFQPLPLGSIKPSGWLQDQMQLMSDGLAGHEHDFYRWVKESSWLGGDQEYSGLNEGFPYWFNGLVPLAYGLDDDRLKGQVSSAMDYVLAHQTQDGWIGPEQGNNRNFWARYPLFLGMTQLAEANKTEAGRIIPALQSFVGLMHSMLADNYTGYILHNGDTFDASWGLVRSHDMILSLQWLYENAPGSRAQDLLDNMKYMNDKADDWSWWYRDDVFPKQDLDTLPASFNDPNFQFEHGVNAAQGLKAGAVIRRFTHDDSLADSSRRGVDYTFSYHGASSGTIIADERMSGLKPLRGSELCTAVEAMYSLSYLYHTLGDNTFADRCELAAFNALPTMLLPDWWAHQYVAEPNQPYSIELDGQPFFDVNTVGQTFGLEPNYPCCTVNHPQGYPKFLSASLARNGDNGLVHALLAPMSVKTDIDGSSVLIDCETNYPFENRLQYTIQADKVFDFYVRVPGWYVPSKSSVSVNGGKATSLQPDGTTGTHKISVGKGKTTITYTLGANVIVSSRQDDAVAIHYGALLYALDIKQSIQKSGPGGFNGEVIPSQYLTDKTFDYRINGTTPWAVAIDPSTVAYQETQPSKLPNPIFTSGAPPGQVTVQACEIDWGYDKGVPTVPPPKDQRKCKGDAFQAKLIPYGASKLHMAELPTISIKSS